MRRRALLAALGSLPLAGCSGSADGPPDRTPAPSPTLGPGPTPERRGVGETATVDGRPVTVVSVRVGRSVIRAHTWRTVHEPPDAQFLVARLAVAPDDAAGEIGGSLGVRLDGDPAPAPDVDLPDVPLRLSPAGSRFGIPVPVREAAAADLVAPADAPAVAWELPADVRRRLAAAPEFRLRGAAVSESAGGTVLELTVENRGGRDGTFRGVVASAAAADADAPVRIPVPAGDTVTRAVRNDIVGAWEPDDELDGPTDPDTRRFAVRDA